MAFILIEKAKVERIDPLMEDEFTDQNGNKRTSKRCNISVRENNDYKRNGQTFPRQGQPHFCTGWEKVADKMSKLKVDDEVQITGFSEVGTKMFMPTSKGGVSFNIPQPGRSINVTLPTGKTFTLAGRASPYDMIREPAWDSNWHLYDAPTIKVTTIEEATSANAGEFWHSFLKNNPRYDKNNPRYVTYLYSSAWIQKKEQVLQRDGNRCTNCGSNQELEIHHKTYDNIGKEKPDSDLLTLCRPCHLKHHEEYSSYTSQEGLELENKSFVDILDLTLEHLADEMSDKPQNVMEPPKSLLTHTTEEA